MDNASGLAAVLAVARVLVPRVRSFRRGVRLASSAERSEPSPARHSTYTNLDEFERRRIALNVNVDSVGGSPHLAALTSGFPGLEPFLLRLAKVNGMPLRMVRPLMQNLRPR